MPKDLCSTCLYCRGQGTVACMPSLQDFETKPGTGVVRCGGFQPRPKEEFRPNAMQTYAMYGAFMGELGLKPPKLDDTLPDESTFLDMVSEIQNGIRELRRRFEPADDFVTEFRDAILKWLVLDETWQELNGVARSGIERTLDRIIRKHVDKLGEL